VITILKDSIRDRLTKISEGDIDLYLKETNKFLGRVEKTVASGQSDHAATQEVRNSEELELARTQNGS
jgi:hypothetical protein